MPSLKTVVRQAPDGEVRYFFKKGKILAGGGIDLENWKEPNFILVSRKVNPHGRGRVDTAPMVDRSVERSYDQDRPTLLLIFPEGGPITLTVGKKAWKIHPHEYGLTYLDHAYTIETFPQPVVTHRISVLMNYSMVNQVWEKIRGTPHGLLPVLEVGVWSRSVYLSQLMALAFREGTQRKAVTWVTAEFLAHHIMAWLFCSHPHGQAASLAGPVTNPIHDRQAQEALEYLQAHLGARGVVREAARAAGLHVNALTLKMKQIIGLSPVEYLQRCRIDRVQTLLRTTSASMQEIREQVGYEKSQFAAAFRQATGMTPLAYRAKHRVLSIMETPERK